MKAMKEVQAKSSIEANDALQSINKQLTSLNVKILAVRGRAYHPSKFLLRSGILM